MSQPFTTICASRNLCPLPAQSSSSIVKTFIAKTTATPIMRVEQSKVVPAMASHCISDVNVCSIWSLPSLLEKSFFCEVIFGRTSILKSISWRGNLLQNARQFRGGFLWVLRKTCTCFSGVIPLLNANSCKLIPGVLFASSLWIFNLKRKLFYLL